MTERQKELDSIFSNLSAQLIDPGARVLLDRMKDHLVSAEAEIARLTAREAVLVEAIENSLRQLNGDQDTPGGFLDISRGLTAALSWPPAGRG